MLPPRRSSRMAPGSAFLMLLLLLMLGLSAVLAYQGLDAAQSEARSTERALRGYADHATQELSRHADEVLAERITAALARALPESPDAETPPLAELAARARAEMAWCACPGAVREAFHAELRGGRPVVRVADAAGAPRAAVHAHALAAALEPALRGAAGDETVAQAVSLSGQRRIAVYRVRAGDGGGVRADGFTLDPARVAEPAFAEVVRSTPLLPKSLRDAHSNGDVAVQVTTAGDEVVFRSPAAAGAERRDGPWLDAKIGPYPSAALAPGEVVESPGGLLDGLTTRVAVRPEVAAGGAAGGEPRSPLPLLLTFALTLALSGTAIVQLRRQQELVRLRDDFVSGVSHELRTPLAQIRLFADLLESGRLEAPEQRRRSIRIINEESRRLTYLVENILHFSRAQRGTGRVAAEPVEVGPLVHEIVEAFAPLARTRDVEFAVRAEEGVVARIDRDALRQVLLNLLDNAVKYGPRGQRVGVAMDLAGFALRIRVDDQGPGIPRDERPRVWEPYRRLERDADSATGGSGIGLAVVRDLVELHGGRVWVGDAPGGGARFTVELPGAVHAGPPAPAAEEDTNAVVSVDERRAVAP